MVTKRHSSQRAVKQGPAVTVRSPIKSGHPRLDNFRGRKPTPYGGLPPASREGVDLRAAMRYHKILCTGRNVLETRHFGAGFCRRGFWAGGETRRSQKTSCRSHLTTAVKPLRTQPHSQSESVHNSGITPSLPNTTWSLNCRVPRDDTFLRLLRFEIELLLQVEIFYGVSDSCQSPALLCLRSVPEGRALRSPGVTRLPRYYGPVRLPAEPALLARTAELRTPPGGTSLPALRSPLADMPCPLPRRTEPVRMSVASRLVLPSPYLRRVGVHDFTFEACSGLLRVTACQLARPAFSGLCHEASARPITRPSRSSASMLTDNYIGGLLPPTGCPRRKGALRKAG